MDDRAITRSFRRGFATLLVVDLGTKALTAATVLVLIRGLSVALYAYVTVLFTLAQVAASAGGGGILTRYLREESEQASRGSADGSEEHLLQALLKASLIITGFGLCAIPVVAVFGIGSGFGSGIILVALATTFAAGSNATDLAIARYQARRRFSKAGLLSALRACALLVAACIVSFAQSELVIGVWLVGSMLVVGLASTGRVFRASSAGRHLSVRFTREEAWLSFFSFAAAGFAYIDILVASVLLNEHQVSTLGASLRYWALVLSAMPALGAVLRVRTAQVDIVDSAARQRAMVFSWIRRTFIPTTLITGAAFLLAPSVIPAVDGGKYPESVETFQIFLVTALAAYITAPAGTILIARRRYDLLGSVYAVGLIINLIGDVLVARSFGVYGIAVVSSTVYVAIALTVTALAVRETRPTARRSPARIDGPPNSR